MRTNSRVQQIVNSISQEFHKIFANEAVLIWFGSWVKGNACLQSDIDLAIKHEGRDDAKKILKFRQYLEAYPTLYKIDFVDMSIVGEQLKSEIDKYGKVL